MRNVAVLVLDTVRPFELAVHAEVFGVDRTAAGVPSFAYAVCGERPGVPVRGPGGVSVTPAAGLDRLEFADLVAVASPAEAVSAAVGAALQAAVRRGARVVAVGAAVTALRAAGLVKHGASSGGAYAVDGVIGTATGAAAGIDLCLHLVRLDHGPAAASAIAAALGHERPRRDEGLADVLRWALGNLHEDLSIDRLAGRASLSRRSFVRRFRAATGSSPYAWVVDQRLRLAQRLLETDAGVEDAAARAGFSSAALLRQHFRRRLGCTPSEYRTRFAATSPG